MTADTIKAAIVAFYQTLALAGEASPASVASLEARIACALVNEQITWQDAQGWVEQCVDYATLPLHWQWCLDDGVFRLPYQTAIAPVS